MKMKKKLIAILLGSCLMLTLTVCSCQTNSSKEFIEAIEQNESTETNEKNESEEIIDNADEIIKSIPEIVEQNEISINLGNGLYITEIGNYTGVYVEDGSDELVSDIMMLVVKNKGEEIIQYAEIKVPVEDEEALFALSTSTPGSTMILLEQNRKSYVELEYTTAIVENVVIFEQPLNLYEDKLEIQLLDGLINVSNISGKDINEDIVIYYKNSAVDVFYGGITYRVKLEGGLKSDEIKQIMAGHISKSGNTVMFVTCGEGQWYDNTDLQE